MCRLLVAYAIVAILYVSHVNSQVPFLGRCPKVSVQQNFELERYTGVWFEHKKYFAIFEAGGTCITATYNNDGNDVIGVVNRQYNPLLRRYTTITGNAVPVSSSGEGKLRVRFPTVVPNPFDNKTTSNYMVLGTDYSNYSVVWACQDFFIFNVQFAWILTRDQRPDESVIKNAESVFAKNGLQVRALLKTDQSKCSTR